MSATAQRRRIRALPPVIANQIAAGEVVERPASVVKELLENALDAGARRVDVHIERGGVALIRVDDDGEGIPPDELPLAVDRHATSKVYDSEELHGIRSLGFRGEALASVASVSRLSLASRAVGEAHGWRLEVSPGHTPAPPVPDPRPAGTRVEVRDLFHNTPARRKFLRTERTEFGHVEETVRRLALSRYDVAFSLSHNGRRVFAVAAAQTRPEDRIAALMGRAFLRRALRLSFEAGSLRLSGWVTPAAEGRAQADLQYFFVNGRVVRDKLVNHAVRQAFQEMLEAGRHPGYVLYLAVDPEQVDVNVHPTKHEVRFREARLVHDFIARRLAEALSQSAPELPLEEAVAPPRHTAGTDPRPAPAPVRQAAPSPREVAEAPSLYERLFARSAPEAEPTPASPTPPRPGPPRPPIDATPPPAPVLAVGEVLVSERDGQLWLIPRQPARQALLAARLREGLARGAVPSRPLLVPQRVPLEPSVVQRLLAGAERLRRLGVELDELGRAEVALRALPKAMRRDGASAEWLQALAAVVADEAEDDALIAACARFNSPEGLESDGALVAALARQPALAAAVGTRLDERALARLCGEGGA